jgi:hypothetical protein
LVLPGQEYNSSFVLVSATPARSQVYERFQACEESPRLKEKIQT